MITLNELYTDPRFKKMSVEELKDFVFASEQISEGDWEILPGNDSPEKAQILYERLHSMDNNIRLKEGMGVVNATIEQQRAIRIIAQAKQVGIREDFNLGNVGLGHLSDNVCYMCGQLHGNYPGTPVTFTQFIQAILNEPEKVKEVKVELNILTSAWVSKEGVVITENGYSLAAKRFPLSKIDELAAAKKEVEK